MIWPRTSSNGVIHSFSINEKLSPVMDKITNQSFKLSRMSGKCHTVKFLQQRSGMPRLAVNDLTRLLQYCLYQLNALICASIFPVE
jgi:hypothetical protein